MHMFISLCVCACRLSLNQKCQRSSKPELIRWEQESLERRKNWEKPLIDTELSWEICSNFLGLTESHSQYKACLFITVQASSTTTHAHTHFDDCVCLKHLYDRSSRVPMMNIHIFLVIFIKQYSNNPLPNSGVKGICNFLVCRKQQLSLQTESNTQSYIKIWLIRCFCGVVLLCCNSKKTYWKNNCLKHADLVDEQEKLFMLLGWFWCFFLLNNYPLKRNYTFVPSVP